MAERIVGYVRVSLKKQVDGYSLDAQEERIREYAAQRNYEVAQIYYDKGESGKDIENRTGFKQMLHDIRHSDDIKYVIVFKLSRFGRSTIDILTSIKELQRYGVELYTVDEGIDTGTQQGKIMVFLLGVLAEIERENILAQTMAGRNKKAELGGWNGGFAPYGYKLIKSLEGTTLEVIESRARQVRLIFDLFVNQGLGYMPIVQYMNSHGEIRERNENDHNRQYDDWTNDQVKKILGNPLYTGRIAYGRTKSVLDKKKNKYVRIQTDDYILSEQVFEPIISDEVFEKAKAKLSVKSGRGNLHIGKYPKHLLSGICLCPDCGKSMVIDTNQWTDKHGVKHQNRYYCCKHYKTSGEYGSCRKNSVPAESVENEVIRFTKKLIADERFAEDIKQRIGTSIDVSEIDKEIDALSKQLSVVNKQVRNTERQIDDILEDDRHAERRRASLNKRLDEFYDKLDILESDLADAKAKRAAASKSALTTEIIYKQLMCFDRIYDKMDDTEKRALVESMIDEVTLYTQEERAAMTDTVYVKDIKYSFPVSDKVLVALREKDDPVECVVLMSSVKE